jgi:hypothetical protein
MKRPMSRQDMIMKITMARIIRAAQDDDGTWGFCLACGHKQSGCEPDTRNYECHECGATEVFGAEEIAAGLI